MARARSKKPPRSATPTPAARPVEPVTAPSTSGGPGRLTRAALALAVALGVAVAWRVGCSPTATRVAHAADAGGARRTVRDEGPRASGAIESEGVILPQPAGYVTSEDCARFPNHWSLDTGDLDASAALFARSVASPSARASLAAATRCAGGRCAVTPPLDVVRALSPTERAALYRDLARVPDNHLAVSPYRRPASFGPWSAVAGLSPAAREVLDRCSWRDGDALVFADVPLACAALPADGERVAFFAALKQRFALRARVRVDAGVDAMVRYWSTPGDEARVRAVLDGAGEEGAVSLGELLPPMARARLDRFPALTAPRYDCFWTALHFFDAAPPDHLPGLAGFVAEIARSYEPAPPDAMRLGDVIVLYDANDQCLHAMNHVADDLVFSKDGGNPRRPWVLQHFAEIRRGYPAAVTVRIWRRRGPSP